MADCEPTGPGPVHTGVPDALSPSGARSPDEPSRLGDVSFLLPFHPDCDERLRHLAAVAAWIRRHFDSPVFVGGHDLAAAGALLARSGHDGIKTVAAPALPGGAFWCTATRNALAGAAATELVAVWDVDVWCEPGQVRRAAADLRAGRADFAYPYDGTFLHVTDCRWADHLRRRDGAPSGSAVVRHPGESHGGAVLFRAEVYAAGGGENTGLHGWGPEDLERYLRFTRLGYRCQRVPGPLLHLDHDRPHGRYRGQPDFAANVALLAPYGAQAEEDARAETCPVCLTEATSRSPEAR